jgi:ABC-type antimicrobial peptide transport system permease subunit
VWGTIDRAVRSEFRDKDVHRVYKYDFSEYALSQKAFISVHFNDLHKLRDFEAYVRDNFNVNIEMSQINAKENFNAVSIMGNTLSWGIIVFAIVCIILFIVNLLQSYFQKVKRNLGTFKAFGISNRDLISVYVLIMAAIIISAIFMSVSVTWIVQGIMHICGVLKDGVHDYLSLWSYKTVSSIVIIIVAAIYTVYAVMHKLLKATPGDLIYDRQ